jgi:hypothetical protein
MFAGACGCDCGMRRRVDETEEVLGVLGVHLPYSGPALATRSTFPSCSSCRPTAGVVVWRTE